MAVQLLVHDFAKEEDMIFGPYSQLDLHEKSVWAHDISGRKFRVADKDPLGFWIINDVGGHFVARVKEIWVREATPTQIVRTE